MSTRNHGEEEDKEGGSITKKDEEEEYEQKISKICDTSKIKGSIFH